MIKTMISGKTHKARVTESNLNYAGSITIDADILDAVNILPNGEVVIVDNNDRARFETYAIAGERGSGKICLNDAAFHLVKADDVVIIMTYVQLNEHELTDHALETAIMNENNEITQMIHEKESTIIK